MSAAMSSSISIVCVSASEKVVNQCTVRVPATATIADLKVAMQRSTRSDAKKTVQVLVGGAVPSEAALLGDLAAAYASKDGLLHVNYSIEASFGADVACNPLTAGCTTTF